MTETFFSRRNLRFLLYEVHDILQLTRSPYYAAHNKNTFDMILDAAAKLAADLLRPILTEMDRHPPELLDGRVRVHPAVRHILAEFGAGGWIGAAFPNDLDGEQLPIMLTSLCGFVFAAANYSAAVYPEITAGAARLIASFGSRSLIDTYLPRMLAGKWQGTMALTEPQAGSSLTDITTMAACSEGEIYRIRGQKIFISAGDHDGAENVIHLMLARIEGAPAGIRGISLFLVPKLRIDSDGGLIANDITVTQIYHKLGYRGTPITELSIGERDDCIGYLVGAPNKGLAYMFQMMNEERIAVGCGAAAIASAAYYAALEYCRLRPQGRAIALKDPSLPQIPIIEHTDVKRMLLFQRAVVEGSLALILQCARYADLAKIAAEPEKRRYELLLDILTPVAKSYPAEMGLWAVSQALQCLGGYGYCEDFPLEQYFRDVRIHPIHEGTTGIQAMDLLGRKVVMHDGRAFALYLQEVQAAVASAGRIAELKTFADRLNQAVEALQGVTTHLVDLAQTRGSEHFLADATLYLEFFGIIAVAWQWLLQALAAIQGQGGRTSGREFNFYQGKIFAFRYFFAYELPKTRGLADRLMEDDPVTLEMTTPFFKD